MINKSNNTNDAQRALRKAKVAFAKYSVGLDDFELSKELEIIVALYVDGVLTVDEIALAVDNPAGFLVRH